MAVIEAEQLCKQFRYSTKAKGLKGTLHNLFERQKLTKTAVDNICADPGYPGGRRGHCRNRRVSLQTTQNNRLAAKPAHRRPGRPDGAPAFGGKASTPSHHKERTSPCRAL